MINCGPLLTAFCLLLTSSVGILHLERHLLHLPHDAQYIAAQGFLQIFLAIPATGKFLDQIGKLGNVFHAARRGVNAVEVGPQPHVIDTHRP